MQELIGPFHPHFIARSPKKRKYFEKDGTMKSFPDLSHYPLEMILQIKNKISAEEARHFAGFLLPTLIPEPEKRVTAEKALLLPWLSRKIPSQYKMYSFIDSGKTKSTRS